MAKKIKYPLAVEKLEGLDATPDEKLELNRICSKERHKELARIIFLLSKMGKSKDTICAYCEIEDRLYKRIKTMIYSSEFLKDQIKFALEHLQGRTTEDTEDIIACEGEVVEDENSEMIVEMEKKMAMLLNAITPEKINDADLDKIANAFAKIFDKYRTATGQSNLNVMGVQALLTSGDTDMKRQDKLEAQVKKIRELLLATGMNNAQIDEYSKKITPAPKTGT